MPISPLTWKALTPVTLSSLTEAGYISALKSAFDSTTYKDGTARNPNAESGVAWKATSLSGGSIKCTPVAKDGYLKQLIHFVQATGNTSLTTAFGEAITGGRVYANLVLNPSDTYTANVSDPFGTTFNDSPVRQIKYFQVSPDIGETNTTGLHSSTGVKYCRLSIWESQDALIIHTWFSTNADGSSAVGYLNVYGGWIAPDISAGGAADAESDGLLYGIATSGCTNTDVSTDSAYYYHNSTSNFLNHNSATATATAARKNARCVVFEPGSSNLWILSRMGRFNSATQNFTTKSKKLAKIPIYFDTTDYFVGRAREIWAYRRVMNGLVMRSGGSGGLDIAYLVSPSDTLATDSLIIAM
jgi:hypothetical protein